VLDEMKLCGSQKTEMELRTLLGCFLFSGDDVEKKIKVLSGGEKARVALAKTIVSKANFLMLDEPTNHLDIHSCELLIDALNKYQGSLILVSHDRYFISKTANKIWEIDDLKIREFKGTYAEWVEWKERRAIEARTKKASDNLQLLADQKSMQKNQKNGQDEAAKPAPSPQKVAEASKPVAINKDVKKELQKQQRLFQELENRMSALALQKKQFEADLTTPEIYSDNKKFSATELSYKKANDELTRLNKQYEEVFEQIVNLEANLTS
jgi:ATP-binding cassette subfamily F protein 3